MRRAGSHERRAPAGRRGARHSSSGRMRADRSGTKSSDWPLRGQLQMATGELGFITLYAPEIDRASGHFDANLNFEGTLGRPVASGVIKLSDAELDFYQLNLALRARRSRKRASSPTTSSSAPRRRPATARWRARERSSGAKACRTATSTSAAKTCAWSTCPRRASMRRPTWTSASPRARSSSRARSKYRWRASRRPISPTPCCPPPTR